MRLSVTKDNGSFSEWKAVGIRVEIQPTLSQMSHAVNTQWGPNRTCRGLSGQQCMPKRDSAKIYRTQHNFWLRESETLWILAVSPIPGTWVTIIVSIIAESRLNYRWFFVISSNTGNITEQNSPSLNRVALEIFYTASIRKCRKSNRLKSDPIKLVISSVWQCFLCGKSSNEYSS